MEMGGTRATGLSRENVACHLQLERTQLINDVINFMGPSHVQRTASTHRRRELVAYSAQTAPKKLLDPLEPNATYSRAEFDRHELGTFCYSSATESYALK